jgi:Uma2 family endonuclease
MERGCPVTQPAFAVDTWPDFWTEADLAALPDDGHRYEIIDGSLIVTPPADDVHQGIAANILVSLRTSAPSGWRVLADVGVRTPRGSFIPDLVALRPRAARGVVWREADNVRLVVEVASSSTELIDRGIKAIAYAEAGIPVYWRIGRDGTVVVHTLVGESYDVTAVVKPGDTWQADSPFPVTIDPEVLLA